MNKTTALKTEAVGLAILLLATAMHMFTLWNQTKQMETDFYRVNERLYVIYQCNQEILKQQKPENGYCLNNSTLSEWERLNYFDTDHKIQVTVFNWVYIILYFVGSGMLVIGKFSEADGKAYNK